MPLAWPFAVAAVVVAPLAAGFGEGGAPVGDAEVPRKSFTALPRSVPTFEPQVDTGLGETAGRDASPLVVGAG